MHHGRHEHRPQDEGVKGNGGGQPDAELGDADLAPDQHERDEDGDHDRRGGGDHPGGAGLAGEHRPGVVTGSGPFLGHGADQEHLVVHGQAEQYREH